MTAHKKLKSIIREHQKKTGESYTAARAKIVCARVDVLRPTDDLSKPEQQKKIEAIVLKVNHRSVRVRIPSEDLSATLRTSNASEVVPGHVVTLAVKKRWSWRGHCYANGAI